MLRALFSAAVFFGCLCQGLGQVPERALWLDVDRVDVRERGLVSRTLAQPVRRLIVAAFRGGQTLFAKPPGLFRQMELYRGKGDPLREILQQAHQQGKEVWAFVDAFYWTLPGTPVGEDLLARNPDLAERDRKGGCGLPTAGKFASPFNPKVRQALHELVNHLAKGHPHLDGLVLRCGLPAESSLLGFSEGSRVAFIRARQLDPMDLASGADQELFLEWSHWRTDEVSKLVKELGQVFKAHIPKGKVAALGYANWYRLSPEGRNKGLEDWLNWALAGAVDEVILDCRWDLPPNKDTYSFCKTLASRAKKPISLTPLVALREGHEVLTAGQAWENLRPFTEVMPGVVLRISDARDLEQAPAFWKATMSGVGKKPTPLPKAAASSLRADPRLALRLTLDLKSPTLPVVLGHLQKATGLIFSSPPSFNQQKPVFPGVSWRNVPAWQIMEQVSQMDSVQGHWEKTEGGYQLMPREGLGPNIPQREKQADKSLTPAGDEGISWWIGPLGGGLGVLIVGGLWMLFVRFCRGKKDRP